MFVFYYYKTKTDFKLRKKKKRKKKEKTPTISLLKDSRSKPPGACLLLATFFFFLLFFLLDILPYFYLNGITKHILFCNLLFSLKKNHRYISMRVHIDFVLLLNDSCALLF